MSMVSIPAIQSATARHFSIPLEAMTSDRRSAQFSRPRQVAMYLATKLTRHSLPVIGRSFGGRDHTTVMHAAFRVEDLCRQDGEMKAAVESLREELAGGPAVIDPAAAAENAAIALANAITRLATRDPERFLALVDPLLSAAVGLEGPAEPVAAKVEAPKAKMAPKPGLPTRPCMCCGKPFHSQGAHNRLCEPCRRKSE